MKNYTVLVKKKLTSEVTKKKYNKRNQEAERNTQSLIHCDQLRRKKVKIKKYKLPINESSKIKIIKIIRRNVTSTNVPTTHND